MWIFLRGVEPLKSPSYFQLKTSNPAAFVSLNRHLSIGGFIKKFGVVSLSLFQNIEVLVRLPILGGLLLMVRGLIYGHITETSNFPFSENDMTLKLSTFESSKSLIVVDVLIIGSGPGGAVAAQRESSANNVLVVERGLLPRTPHQNHHTLGHVMNDFNLAGQELILSANIPQFAQARVIGGGSEINSGLYHKLPEKIKDEFVLGLKLTHAQWDASETHIENWLDPIAMDVRQNQSVIALGAQSLGLENVNVPRWRTYDTKGGFVHRGMIETFWSRFVQDLNHNIQYGIEIKKIDVSNSEFVRIIGFNYLTSTSVEYRAKRVHVSAGPISTPYLLAKSGLISWSSTDFQWHPMIRVVARTNEDVLGWNDIDPFQAWTSDRKLKFGSAVSTSSLLAINLRKQINEKESRSLRSYYVSFSSTGKGGIVPYTSMPWYRYSETDRKLSSSGLTALRDLVSAGGGKILNQDELEPMKQSTVHIFGSLPANSSSYIPGTSRLISDERILVSDGSLLPIGPGVNPQGVIMSTVDALLRVSL